MLVFLADALMLKVFASGCRHVALKLYPTSWILMSVGNSVAVDLEGASTLF
jgi:hypothetical protein